ncbi:MAG: Uma2 family endonuclease [bacterium]|nr:Uma2 family endonuclease [bacterium]
MLPEKIREVLSEKRKITIEEYLQLPETNIHTELIDGELFVYDGQEGNMAGPTVLHQKISRRIVLLLSKILSEDGLYYAPIDVILNDNAVQPDILWISPNNTSCHELNGRLYGAPDFVVEILSPSTHRKDKGAKFDLYDQHGVQEYWIVDPQEQLIEVYTRQDEFLRRQGGYEIGKTFTSRILNNTVVDISALLG